MPLNPSTCDLQCSIFLQVYRYLVKRNALYDNTCICHKTAEPKVPIIKEEKRI